MRQGSGFCPPSPPPRVGSDFPGSGVPGVGSGIPGVGVGVSRGIIFSDVHEQGRAVSADRWLARDFCIFNSAVVAPGVSVSTGSDEIQVNTNSV